MRVLSVFLQGIALLVGVSLSATCSHVLFVLCAVHKNFFSGIDPASTVGRLPTIIVLELFAGIALLGVLRLLGRSIATRPHDLLFLGLVLGWGAVGQVFAVWFGMASLSGIAAFLVLCASVVVALRHDQPTR